MKQEELELTSLYKGVLSKTNKTWHFGNLSIQVFDFSFLVASLMLKLVPEVIHLPCYTN